MNAITFCRSIGEDINAENFKTWAESNKVQLIDSDGQFTVGDKVTFTNEYGVVFKGHTIIGMKTDKSFYGRYIYTDTDAWWFPHTPEQLKKEKNILEPAR